MTALNSSITSIGSRINNVSARKKGFTILEILLAITIITILTAAAVYAYATWRYVAAEASARQMFNELIHSKLAYCANHSTVTPTSALLLPYFSSTGASLAAAFTVNTSVPTVTLVGCGVTGNAVVWTGSVGTGANHTLTCTTTAPESMQNSDCVST
jgi:prepilin-type N-terminal cleavage/methylation domain-containing protein